MLYEDLKILNINLKGDIFRLHKSKKNGQWIAYTDFGKVILFRNHKELHAGFVEIVSFVDKDRCIIATGKNVVNDFYYGYENDEVIPYDEFQEVLKLHGFVPEYEEKINEDNNFYVWANLKLGSLITIETWNYDGEKTYNSVDVYIPTHSTLAFELMHEWCGFSHGGYNVCCFNLVNCRNEFPLRYVLHHSDKRNISWNGDTPGLWHYGDRTDENMDFIRCIKKIYDFNDKDLWKKFGMDVEGHIKNIERFNSGE